MQGETRVGKGVLQAGVTVEATEGIEGGRPRPIAFTSVTSASSGQDTTASEYLWSAESARMESLFRSVVRPVSFCHRRSLFSVFSPVRSARVGSREKRDSGRWPTLVSSLSSLPTNPHRACSSIAHMSSPTSHPEYRLPPTVKPQHYDLIIRTDLENQTFEGFVAVQYVADLI